MFGLEPIVAAHGRDYESLEAFKKDLLGGLCFKASNGKYCSIRDLKRMRLTTIQVRFNRGQDTGLIELD